MGQPAGVLLIGAESLQAFVAPLEKEGLVVETVDSVEAVTPLLERLTGPSRQDILEDTVVVVDGDLPMELGFELYKALHAGPPVPVLTLVSQQQYSELAGDQQLRSPLDDYVPKPASPGELTLRVRALMLRSGIASPAKSAGGDSANADAPGLTEGQLIVVFAAKGGVGKTTIAVNLAEGLVRFFGRTVVVVDADLWFGDVAVMLNVASGRSIADVAQGGEIDLLRLQSALVRHESGVGLLLRPPDLWLTEAINHASVVQAILHYRMLFDNVVVDLDTSLSEMNLQILENATSILLVTTPEVSAIHHTSRFLEVARSLGLTDRVQLVLNRCGSGVPLGAIEAELGVPAACTLVSAGRTAVEVANRGITLFAHDPNAKEEITRNMKKLVTLLAGGEIAAEPPARGRRAQGRQARGSKLPSLLGGKSS